MQSEKLKPCPFCGSSDVHLRQHPTAEMSWISCVGCGLEAPSETGVSDGDAVAYWNRRSEPALYVAPPATIESLQRENEELRKDKEHIAAEKSGIAKNAHSNVDYWKSQFEAAEAEVKRLNAILQPFRAVSKDWVDGNGWTDVACQKDRIVDWFGPSDFRALASTGGEHHGN